MGVASEVARQAAEESDGGNAASSALLSEYSVTNAVTSGLRTPRTPAAQDRILQVLPEITVRVNVKKYLPQSLSRPKLHSESYYKNLLVYQVLLF